MLRAAERIDEEIQTIERETRDWFPQLDVLVLDEFLAPATVARLRRLVLAQEEQFAPSTIATREKPGGTVATDQRRSLVLDDVRGIDEILRGGVLRILPLVQRHFGLPPFEPDRVDVQVTATGDGGFFHTHIDNGSEHYQSRRLSYVYHLSDEPLPYAGGELRVYETRQNGNGELATIPFRRVRPAQNRIVLFPSSYLHEIEPVRSPSGRLADARITVNGWVHW